jgi:hypothetical protein
MTSQSEVAKRRFYMSGGRTIMDRISESLLTEFSNEHEIAQLPEEERFEHFVCFIAVGQHYRETFDTADILVGKATGIDGIAIIINGSLITDIESLEEIDNRIELDVTFVFVQADRGPSFDAAKIGSFGFAIVDFFKEEPTLPRNEEVSAAAKVMSAVLKRGAKLKGNPACRLYFATTGNWVGDQVLEGRRKAVIDDLLATNLFRDVTFIPLGADGIQKLYRQTKNAIEREFIFEKCIIIPDVPGVTEAYLGFIPISELRKLLADDNDEIITSLFYSNPRDWQDYNDVNSEIKETLKSNDRSRFVLMNNGITIIAQNIRPIGNKFIIQDYQVVNGCQTSHVLFDQADKNDRSIAVPIRLIGTQDEVVINAIIRATNRQTPITEDQFFALQEFPKQLEQFFQTFPVQKRLYFERRDRQYSRQSIEKTRVITQPNIIRAFAAMFLQEAHKTTRSYSALKSKVGKEIFGKGHRMEPYYTAASALYKLEYLFRNGKLESKYKAAKFHILLAVRILGNPLPLPQFMNSHEMESYCKPITTALWDSTKSNNLIAHAVAAVDMAVGSDFNRDNIRTESTTRKVITQCQIEAEKVSI